MVQRLIRRGRQSRTLRASPRRDAVDRARVGLARGSPTLISLREPANRRLSQDDRSGATPPVDVPLKKPRFKIPATACPGPGAPPQTLAAFYWHFIRQTKGWYAAMFVASLCVALLDTVIPLIIGQLVALMEAMDRAAAVAAQWPTLMAMAALVLLARPAAILTDIVIRQNVLVPGATSLIRWQSHWHVVRQSLTFFQNDFAGRIANRVMQTGGSFRESAMCQEVIAPSDYQTKAAVTGVYIPRLVS